jgi:site-specific recombinase XerD
MAKLGNVVMMNRETGEQKNPYEVIQTFLLRKGQDSENTKDTYERHIRDFFRTMRNKELEQLVATDLVFEKNQVEAYQVKLKEHGYKGATVNNAITAIKRVYEKLEDNGFAVSANWFKLERYDEHDTQAYDTLTHNEVLAIIDFVSKTRKGKEKALLVRLAYATAFRKESLLTMKWNQILNENGQWYAKVLGKGNEWSYKKLTDDLYNALMEFKDETGREDIFQLTDRTVQKMMNKIRENFDFGDRNIVFHSFKKASLNEVNIITGGDLKAIQAHGDHKDVSTSLNSYIENKKKEDLIAVDINVKLPLDAFGKLSHEEMVNLFHNLDRNTQIKILQAIGAM